MRRHLKVQSFHCWRQSEYRLQYLHNRFYFTVSNIKGKMRNIFSCIVLYSDDSILLKMCHFSLDFVLESRFIDVMWRSSEDHSFKHNLGKKDTKIISLLSPKGLKFLL